ncbi:hypothetical protein T01_6907 [Trichinella spiralis]|uniref:Uncharacterized protein n=1 Tax=Trichinella spiralis TaxID=6334 RepID=A0A0V1AYY7_TRISP|nr:hypothetical protein T01_6907 [Trichinella spiralis]
MVDFTFGQQPFDNFDNLIFEDKQCRKRFKNYTVVQNCEQDQRSISKLGVMKKPGISLEKMSAIYNVNNETFDKSRQYQKGAIIGGVFAVVIASIKISHARVYSIVKSSLQGNKLYDDR